MFDKGSLLKILWETKLLNYSDFFPPFQVISLKSKGNIILSVSCKNTKPEQSLATIA